MQKHKPTFLEPPTPHTLCDIQRCLRVNDLEEIGDGTHYLDFFMLGLFSFDDWSLQEGVDFWMGFLSFVGVLPDTVTIHPDCEEWRRLYLNYPVQIVLDTDCVWSDGSIGGYCTEFYKDGVEIGNIVRPLGRHLDCGFGLERIERFLLTSTVPTDIDILSRTIDVLLQSGIKPSPTKQGYVLRKMVRMLLRKGRIFEHPLVEKERKRCQDLLQKMPSLKRRHPNKPKEFFWDTFGIHPDEWEVEMWGKE